ncbi:MAG: hydrogenase nickel incorporation protein HypB [Spirochaetota bacterium]|nr:MAG: hydrogenase nickel incorporation protein HypB [Spirochaetota bacterium]
MKISVMSDILKANDLLAEDIKKLLFEKNITAWNLMGSPGSGKTAILERLIPMLPETLRAAVIEGDLATSNDAVRIARTGVQSTQINTGGACHLDAAMIRSALEEIEIDAISILFIENVGNLVCPSSFSLGESGRIIVSSITEGDDKPEKYPSMFKTADLVLVNKMDLLGNTNFQMESFMKGMRKVNRNASVLPVSAIEGTGFDSTLQWLLKHVKKSR